MTARNRVKQKSKSASFPSWIKKIILVVLVFSLMLIGFWFFKIDQIVCFDQENQELPICSQLNFLKGKSLFFSKLESTPLYQSSLTDEQGNVYVPLSVTRKLPQTLMIEFSQEDPWYSVLWQDKLYIVNSQDQLVPATNDDLIRDKSLITVNLSDSYQSEVDINSLKINHDLNLYLRELTQAVKKRELVFKSINLNQDQSSIVFERTEFIFEVRSQDPQELAAQIKIILDGWDDLLAELEAGQQIETIDLRFDLPVVKTKP